MGGGNRQENDLLGIILRSLGLGVQIAGLVVVAVLGSLFLGLWVDRKLGSSPAATLLLLALGTLVAVVGMYRVLAPTIAEVAADQGMEWGESLRSLAFAGRIGLLGITPLLVGLFLGLLIDDRLNTLPWMTLGLTVLGAGMGLVGGWRVSSRFLKRTAKDDQEEGF